MTTKILVTGATGNVATLVLPQLKQKGATVRVLLRNDAKAADYKAQGYEVAIGDYTNKASLKAAMQGIDACFFVAPMNADSHKWVESFLDVAKEVPSMRIVRLSALKSNVNGPTNNTKLHGQSDALLSAGPNPWVSLQPQFFMQNLMWSAGSILGEGKFYMGMADGKIGMIDARDIADCATACLLDSKFDYGCYTLTGPTSIGMTDVAQTFSSVLGKEVSYVAIPGAALEKSMKEMGQNDWAAATMRQYGEAYAAGWGNFTNGLVEQITGHAPRSFDVFVKEVFLPLTQK